MPTAYIALGANLGDREANIRAALADLAATPGIAVTAVSSLLDNPAVGGPAGSPSFLNAAAQLETDLNPHDLLAQMQAIETELGRVRKKRWGPRPIDLDLLLYGERIIDTPGLKVPHPLMHQRRFVLQPLAQIAPDRVHPVLRMKIAELLKKLPV